MGLSCNPVEHTQSGISPLFSPADGDLLRVRPLGRIAHQHTALDLIFVKHGRFSDVPRNLQGAFKLVDELGLQAFAAIVSLGAQRLYE